MSPKKNSVLLQSLIYFLSLTFLNLIIYFNNIFNEPSLEQILFFIQINTTGFEDYDRAFIYDFLLQNIVTTTVATAVLLSTETYLNKTAVKSGTSNTKKHSSTSLKLAVKFFAKLPLFLVIAGISVELWFMEIPSFVERKLTPKTQIDYFGQNYIYPSNVEITAPQKTKNLVLFYVESLDAYYNDKLVFGTNMVAPLTRLIDQGKAIQFQSYKQQKGALGTLTGMMATHCSLPMKSFLFANRDTQGRMLKKFLPNAECFSDTLANHAYYNVYLAGSSLKLAGQGKFYKSHSYRETYGKWDWQNLKHYADTDKGPWGLHDRELLIEAKKKLDQLQEKGSPFILTVLTTDMHGPEGLSSKTCQKQYGTHFKNIIECTVAALRDFVDHAFTSGAIENTNILIIGDHRAWRTYDIEKEQRAHEKKNGQRDIFNLWISNDLPQKNREQILHYDMPATILEFIGFEVVGARYGIGYSAFSKSSIAPPENRFEDMDAHLLDDSDTYLNLWGFKD